MKKVVRMKKPVLLFLTCLFSVALICGLFLIIITSSTAKTSKKLVSPDSDAFPDDFSIRYEEWIDASRKNILDTKEGFIQKDLVLDGTAETAYHPSEEVLRMIWAKAVNTGFFSIDSAKLPKNGRIDSKQSVSMSTVNHISITIEMDGQKRTLSANSYTFYFQDRSEDARQFCNFCRFMSDFFENTDEYRALPKAKSGYA